MNVCIHPIDGATDEKKIRLETPEVSDFSENNLTCVPQLRKQVKDVEVKKTLKIEDNPSSNVIGKSVKDIKEEAEKKKLLLLGFVPSTHVKIPGENNDQELSVSSGIQFCKPRARLYLPSKPVNVSELEPCCQPVLAVLKSSMVLSYRIDRSELATGSVFDSHCHLDMVARRLEGDSRGLVGSLERDGEGLGDKFGGCVTNFCDPREWARGGDSSYVSAAVTAADIEDRVYLSVGCHPHFADRLTPGGLIQLDRLVRGEGGILSSVVSLGECGLDYSAKNTVDKELQKKVFIDQLQLALKYNLPLVLHIRDAEEDGYSVLDEAGVPSDWIIHRHCFTGDWAKASTWLAKFPASKIGITGCVTFSRATQVHQTARNIPLERLLLETDAPYFLPTGVDKMQYQYSFSQPGHVLHVAAMVAALKKLPLEEVLAANRRNVTEIYGIKFKIKRLFD